MFLSEHVGGGGGRGRVGKEMITRSRRFFYIANQVYSIEIHVCYSLSFPTFTLLTIDAHLSNFLRSLG